MTAQKLKIKSEEIARTLKLLAHSQRLLILCHLVDGTKTVSEIAELCQNSSQSQISQFLSRMKSEGIVKDLRRGKYVSYSIENPQIFELFQALNQIFCKPETQSVRRKK